MVKSMNSETRLPDNLTTYQLSDLGQLLNLLCLNFLICIMGVIITHTSQDTRILGRKRSLCLLNILETERAWNMFTSMTPISKNEESVLLLAVSTCICTHNDLPIISNKSGLHQYLLPLSAISPSLLALSPQALKMLEYEGVKEWSTEAPK